MENSLFEIAFQDSLKNALEPLENDVRELKSMLAGHTPKQPVKYHTSKEVQKLYQISPVTLWRWKKSGQIKFVKIGGRVLFPVEQ